MTRRRKTSGPPSIEMEESGLDATKPDGAKDAAEVAIEAAEVAALKASGVTAAVDEIEALLAASQGYIDPAELVKDTRPAGEFVKHFRGTRVQALRHWRQNPDLVPMVSKTERMYCYHELMEEATVSDKGQVLTPAQFKRVNFHPDQPTFLDKETITKILKSGPLWAHRIKVWSPEQKAMADTGQI